MVVCVCVGGGVLAVMGCVTLPQFLCSQSELGGWQQPGKAIAAQLAR